jgi:galactose-6-phosphate isomerase
MPWIDVTDIMFDPEIAGESFSVIRREETVSPFGESILNAQTFSNVIGQVSPTARNSLVREQSFSSQEKSIQVITAFKLNGAAKDELQRGYQPDLIFWKNGYYIVGEVEDYSQYGAGFVSADCSAYDWTIQVTGGPTKTNFGLLFKDNFNSANIPAVI